MLHMPFMNESLQFQLPTRPPNFHFHLPNNKIHLPQAIRPGFLPTLFAHIFGTSYKQSVCNFSVQFQPLQGEGIGVCKQEQKNNSQRQTASPLPEESWLCQPPHPLPHHWILHRGPHQSLYPPTK